MIRNLVLSIAFVVMAIFVAWLVVGLWLAMDVADTRQSDGDIFFEYLSESHIILNKLNNGKQVTDTDFITPYDKICLYGKDYNWLVDKTGCGEFKGDALVLIAENNKFPACSFLDLRSFESQVPIFSCSKHEDNCGCRDSGAPFKMILQDYGSNAVIKFVE